MRSRKNRSGQKPWPNRERGGGDDRRIMHPPPIHPELTYKHRLRFTCLTAGSQVVTAQNLLDCLLVSSTATAAWDLFDVVKIREVEMWAISAGTPSPTSVLLEFPGQSGAVAGDGRNYSDTSMGIQPAHIRARPERLSGAAQWQASSSFAMFEVLNCSVGTVIDVSCSFRNIEVPPVAAQNATVGAVPGQWYFRGMDGLATGTTKFPPTGVAGSI